MSLTLVMFFKAIILWVWADAREYLAKRRETSRARLFYQEWSKRAAEHPLALPDLSTSRDE